MLQRRGGGSTGVLLIIISMLSISIPTSGIGEGSEDGGIVSGCMAVLCISEIMPDSEGTDSDSWPGGEWVELIAMENLSSFSGWEIIDSNGRSAELDGNLFIEDSQGIVNVSSVKQGNTVLFSSSAVSSWSMKNTNGQVSLRNPEGNGVDEADWVTLQSGISLIRMSTTSGIWVESTVPTPGYDGGRFLTLGGCVAAVCFSEVMINPIDTDGRVWPDGEWIELREGIGEGVDWSKWAILHKNKIHNLEQMIVSHLSNESVMLLDWGGNENTSALTNTRDMIALLDQNMNAVHVFEWNSSTEAESMIYRNESGWEISPVPTPGIVDLEPFDLGRESEVFISRLMPAQAAGISGEWWEIESREQDIIPLFGWELRFTSPSGGVDVGVIKIEVELEAGGRIAFGTEPYELLSRGGPQVLDLDLVMDSAPAFTDSGGMLELLDPQGRLIDVMKYGDISASSIGWLGNSVPIPSTSTQGLIWLRGDGCHGAIDTNSSADWMNGWRKLGGSFFCEPISVSQDVSVIPMVSPGPEALVQLVKWIDGANNSVDVQMYELMSVHIVQALLRAERRGVDVTILLEDSPLDETKDLDMMHGFARLLSESGVDILLIGSDEKNNVQSPYRFLHAKLAVRDGSSVWIGSGNWKDSSFPIGEAAGNRERGVFVHHSGFASQVLTRMEADADVSQLHIRKWSIDDDSFESPEDWEMPEVEMLPLEETISSPPTIDVEQATFYTCPDECVEGIVGLIQEAENTLDLSVQGLSGKWEEEWGENPMITAIEAAAERGVKVRLIHNGYYMNDDVAKMIQRFNVDWNHTLGYDSAAILMNVNSTTLKLHDKTLLIDGEISVLGSLNFVPSAFLRNREHMVVLKSTELGKWLGSTFEEDWSRFDNLTDSDGDGLRDGWEEENGFNRFMTNSTNGPDRERDQDGDGLDALDEQRWGGNPHAADTDGDCIEDDIEVMWAFREGVDVRLAVSSVDADNDGRVDNTTIACDGSFIEQQHTPVNQPEVKENASGNETVDLAGGDAGEQNVAVNVMAIAGTIFMVLIVAVGISIIRGSKHE